MGWNTDRDDGGGSSAYSARDGTDGSRYEDPGNGGRARVDRAIHPGKRSGTDGLTGPTSRDERDPDVIAKGARPGVTAALYLQLHGAAVMAGVRAHLLRAPWPPVHPRATWPSTERLVDATCNALGAQLGAPMLQASSVLEVVHPGNPWSAVDACRPVYGVEKSGAPANEGDPLWDGPLGSRDWHDAVAGALAMLVEGSVRGSLLRLVPRYVAATDRVRGSAPAGAQSAPPSYTDILTSHPVDRAVARALTTPGVVAVAQGAEPVDAEAPAGSTPDTLRPVHYQWQGASDPNLWNWLKVIEPAGATAEEVAETLWGNGQGEAVSFYAYGLTKAAPFFGLPPAWARQFPEARLAEPQGGRVESDDAQHRLVTLAGSAVADELALAQSADDPGGGPRAALPGTRTDAAVVLALLDASTIQVDYLARTLAPWVGDSATASAAAFLDRRRGALAIAAPDEILEWSPVVQGQHDNLGAIAGAVSELSSQLVGAGVHDPEAPQAAPFRDVFVTYARAAASAHLVDTSRALIATAERQTAMLVSHLVQARVRASGVAVGELRAASTGMLSSDEAEQQDRLHAQAAALNSQLLLGNAPAADEVDEVTLSADELAFRSQLRTLAIRLGDLSRLARISTDSMTAHATAAVTDSGVLTLAEGAATLSMRLALVEDALESTNQGQAIAADRRMRDDERRAMRRRQRRAALAAAQQQYAAIGQETNIATFLRTGHESIEDLEQRTRVAQVLASIAILVGVSVLTAGIGNMVTAGARGFMFARGPYTAVGLTRLSRTAMVATRAGGLAVESGLNAGAQSALFGAKYGEAFGEDFLANLASSVAMRPFQQILGDIGSLDDAALGKWRTLRSGQVVLAKGAVMTAEGITSAAVGYVAHRLVSDKEPDPATLESWLLQGASIGVGRFVHSQLGEHARRAEDLAGLKGFQHGRDLEHRLAVVRERADAALKTGDQRAALGALIARRELLHAEQRLLDDLLANPAIAADSGLGLSHVEAMRDQVADDMSPTGTYALLPLRMAGLTEVVTRTVFTGSPDRIEYALTQGSRAGLTFVERDPGRRWSVDLGSRTVEIVVVGPGVGGTFAHLPRVSLTGDHEPAAIAGDNLPPLVGYMDVVVHGTPDSFEVWRLKDGRGEKVVLNHRSLALYIRKSGIPFEGIRLVSCSTGAHPTAIAQHLANKLGVKVLAPNRDLGVRQDGSHEIGKTDAEKVGAAWASFEPRSDLPTRSSRVEAATPPERRVDRFRRERADAALDEIGALPVTPVVQGGRTEYLVTPAAAARLEELLSFLPAVSTRPFSRGLLVRAAGGEWYFTHDAAAPSLQGAIDSRGLSDRSDAGVGLGLPPPNASTLELWGFRGVRDILGRTKEMWSDEEVRDVASRAEREPLIYAGHVGVSMDGGRTIYGFTPQPPPGAGVDETLALLKAHVTMPGQIRDDTQVFQLARQMADDSGWSTTPTAAVLRLDPEAQARIAHLIEGLGAMTPGSHGLGYTFPLPSPENGSYYRDSAGYDASCTANCATWPRLLGLPIPEPSGNLAHYLPALREWAEADHPIEASRAADAAVEGDAP
jgi:hypothetical protein